MADADPRMLLVLDLDETLVWADDRPDPDVPADFQVGWWQVRRRPHLDAFLRGAAERFRPAVWSSAGSLYVQGVVERVFAGHEPPAFVFSGERCVARIDPETYLQTPIKDLRKVARLGFDLRRTLIVDDSPEKVRRHYGNAVYVRPWTGDPADDELPRLLRYLHTLADVADVRRIEKRRWRTGLS